MESESIISALPADWAQKSLRQICASGYASIQVGLSTHSNAADETGIPYVMPENISGDRIRHPGISRTHVSAQEQEHFSLRRGDIVCSRRGDLNRRAIVGEAEEGWLCGSGCLRLRFDCNQIDPMYAYYYLSHPEVVAWISRYAIGSTMPHINKSILSMLPFVVPPLSEQKKIVDVLTALTDKIELNAEMNQSLLEAARTFFRLLVGDWTPDATRADSNVPPNCRLTTLEHCCSRIANGRTPLRNRPRYWNGTIPWMTSTEIRRGIVTSTDACITREGMIESSLKIWPQGTTVVAMVGSTVGQTAILAIDSCANQACCGLISRRALHHYIFLHMHAFSNILQGFVKGSAQQNLNQQTIAAFPILLPDDATLLEFDGRVRPLFERMITNLSESALLQDLRRSLIPLLISDRTPGSVAHRTLSAMSSTTKSAELESIGV